MSDTNDFPRLIPLSEVEEKDIGDNCRCGCSYEAHPTGRCRKWQRSCVVCHSDILNPDFLRRVETTDECLFCNEFLQDPEPSPEEAHIQTAWLANYLTEAMDKITKRRAAEKNRRLQDRLDDAIRRMTGGDEWKYL